MSLSIYQTCSFKFVLNSLRKGLTFIRFCKKHTRACDFYITTPIYYVNSYPHIGHLYSSLLADASFRYHSMLGKSAPVFGTGTDEHGTKVQQAAAAVGIPLNEFCGKISEQFKYMNQSYGVACTDYIRTTDSKHMNTVQSFWNVLTSKGHIAPGSYKGWYCDADEAFLADHQIKVVNDSDGKEIRVSAESGRPVSWVEESNYKFHLPRFKNDLKYWLRSAKTIQPEKFHSQVLRWIEEYGVADEEVSVSRPKTRVYWAIPVPGDDSQTIYVWLDALVNYLTIMGYPELKSWPPHVQVIGKDILKFHAIYWPAFLIAAGLEPPASLMVHSHWTVDGEKMSKSKGNVVCPFNALESYGVDGMRYFLLREGTPHSDSNYSDVKLLRTINAELADTLGNLLNRCCSKTINPKQIFPSFVEEDFDRFCNEHAKELITIVDDLSDNVGRHYSEFNFYKGVALTMSALREANRLFESTRPWELRKSQNQEDIHHLNSLLYLIMETLRVSAIVLTPIVPNLAGKLLDKLSVPLAKRMWSNAKPSWNLKSTNISLDLDKQKLILFKRIQV